MIEESHLVFDKKYKLLNPEQKLAVDTLEGAVMVNAGPGSGKTELLAMRTANLLRSLQINPSNILLLTFTENAAFNMRDRLQKLIGSAAYGVAIYTFHGFANDVINRYGEYFFEGASFRPVTDVEKIGIIENVLSNFPKKSKLSKREFEGGYIFNSDILSCISGLKKGNLDANDFRNSINSNFKVWTGVNKLTNILEEVSGGRKYENIFSAYVRLYAAIKELNDEGDNEYLRYLLNSLDIEILKSKDTGEYKNLNKWRDEFFTKDETGDNYKILKDSQKEKIEKWLELADIYEKFSNEMQKKGLYDFDDMIYLVSRELKENTALRNELEEKFQYIMVDEFQDTNEAQFSLVKNLTSSQVHHGNPNILVVGDDDQAIYKFQGAELSNIYKFLRTYPETKKIILNKNYRSTQNILDLARQSILKGQDRLETRDKSFKKELVSGQEQKVGVIKEFKFENNELEYDYVSNEIKRIIESGVAPEKISIISNKHHTLKDISAYLNIKRIPFSYEKKEHVLEKQPIKELITILEFVNSVTDKNIKDYLLPEILSYKFWHLENLNIWEIAEAVREIDTEFNKRTWFGEILNNKNEKIKRIGEFLLEISIEANSIPLEHLLDKIIGTTEWEFEGEYADLEDLNNNLENINTKYISPFKNYYFGKENFLHNKPEYLDFLFSLRTFIGALREFKQGQLLKAADIDEFLSVYKNNDKLSLTSVSPFASSEKSIHLQTAYKAKGLEYEYVFIINANEKEWNGRGVINKIGFPRNLKLLSESDNYDDKLRLFYVALTRAKHTLYITYSKERLGFMSDVTDSNLDNENSHITENIIKKMDLSKRRDYVENEKALLKRLLENYLMPVTHLTNYLNLGKVGPDKFIEQNLLRFPQAMSESAIYGSAMHYAIQCYYTHYKKHQKLASFEDLCKFLVNGLIKYKMPESIFDKNLIEGKKNLRIYFDDLKKSGGINITDIIEANFKNEGVKFDSVHATGKIDKIIFNPNNKNEITVSDFKTGKSFKSWDPKDSEYTKIKLHFYRYQLAFYKLLIQNSRTYSAFQVSMGQIEFIEADDNENMNTLTLELENELVDRVKRLANIVYSKILDLDFPDTRPYTDTESGNPKEEIKLSDILQFEDDLLSGKV